MDELEQPSTSSGHSRPADRGPERLVKRRLTYLDTSADIREALNNYISIDEEDIDDDGNYIPPYLFSESEEEDEEDENEERVDDPSLSSQPISPSHGSLPSSPSSDSRSHTPLAASTPSRPPASLLPHPLF